MINNFNTSAYIKYDNEINKAINWIKNKEEYKNFIITNKPIIFYNNIIYPSIGIFYEKIKYHRGILRKYYDSYYHCNSYKEYNDTINKIKKLNNYSITENHQDLTYDICFLLAKSDDCIFFISLNKDNNFTYNFSENTKFDIDLPIFTKNKQFFSQQNIIDIIKNFENTY